MGLTSGTGPFGHRPAGRFNLLSPPAEYAQMSRAVNPYGDPHTAKRIVDALRGPAVEEWRPVLHEIYVLT